MTTPISQFTCPDVPGYIAVAFAFAGRFLQLHDASKNETIRPLFLNAATFAIDRTVPSPELNLKVQHRQTNDPIRFLIDSQDLILPVVLDDWTRRVSALRKAPVGPMLEAMDEILSGGYKLTPARFAHILEWLEPVLVKFPELRENVMRAVNEQSLKRP